MVVTYVVEEVHSWAPSNNGHHPIVFGQGNKKNENVDVCTTIGCLPPTRTSCTIPSSFFGLQELKQNISRTQRTLASNHKVLL